MKKVTKKATKRAVKVIVKPANENEKRGRPRNPPLTKLQKSQIEKLAGMGGTWEEIAGMLDLKVNTLSINTVAMAYYRKGAASGKMSIKRKQFIVGVEQENVQMLIWLGKVRCGQKEVQDIKMDVVTEEREPASEILERKLKALK